MNVSTQAPLISRFRGWTLFFCGICMGAADLVPGISGGTIAFILGFYQLLLEGLKSLSWAAFQNSLRGKGRAFIRQVEWKFLLTLLAGMSCAFICFANFIHYILSHEVYRIYLYATFCGLIFASFIFCIQQVKDWSYKTVVAVCFGAFVAFVLTESTLISSSEEVFAVPLEVENKSIILRNYDAEKHLLLGLNPQTLSALLAQGLIQESTPVYHLNDRFVGFVGELVTPYKTSFFNGWLVVCGALAVCALLLPGISGSYILTLLGVYPLVIEALVDFFHSLWHFSFNFEAFSVLGSLSLGIIFGAIAFAKGVSWLLKAYPDLSMAVLSGFMIGAVRSVWPFWTYEYIVMPLKIYKGPQLIAMEPFLPSLNSPLFWQAVFCTFCGLCLVMALEVYVHKKA